MGQENDKVIFQGHQSPLSKRRHIFQKEDLNEETCEIPGCKCSLKHIDTHKKICSNCLEAPPPFVKIGNGPKYVEGSTELKQPSLFDLSAIPYREPQTANSIPTKISYCNAWSLPNHRYYFEDHRYQQFDETIIHEKPPAESKYQNEPIRISKQIQSKPIDNTNRRQNLNIYG